MVYEMLLVIDCFFWGFLCGFYLVSIFFFGSLEYNWLDYKLFIFFFVNYFVEKKDVWI